MVDSSNGDRGIGKDLEKRKSAFSNFNMVRMREALRYLSGPKLSLFISIPFYLHLNQPGLPGFVQENPTPRGILNFRSSGFYRVGLKQGLPCESAAQVMSGPPPCILGLYHIGSLGTFTQSAASDFDYWIIIDKTDFSPQRHRNFQQKLDDIVRYARESCGQKVSFFIMDQTEIRHDCYKGLAERETLTAPKLFLKEEFYRTFLYIAGRIPLWTVLPPGKTEKRFQAAVERSGAMAGPASREFIGLGDVAPPESPDILKGILWHIVKSGADPVKALIKATMIFAHRYGGDSHGDLLCNTIKESYSDAGIDDYRADPYKILFDRIIVYHETAEKSSLNLIKNAVFFRLCSFPVVEAPEEGSPKKQLLDRYIREWNLKPAQVKKLISYRHWSENEKQLLENTFVSRLSQMYARISKDVALDSLHLEAAEKRNMTILVNKARERLSDEEGKIRPCSTYLRSLPFYFFLIRKGNSWELSAHCHDKDSPVHRHRCDTLLGLLGWIMENRLYRRATAQIKLSAGLDLFESADTPCSPDAVTLRFQPVKPLSDDPFEFQAQWEKILVLLVVSESEAGPDQAEFLARNSWGGLFIRQMDLDMTLPVHDRFKTIADTINQYKGDTIRLHFFQLASRRDPEAVHQIMQHLEGRFLSRPPGADLPKRPMLDRL